MNDRTETMLYLPDETFIYTINRIIGAAERSIYIATFKLELTHTFRGRKVRQFFRLLEEKKAAGVDIKILVNTRGGGKHIPRTNLYAINHLKNHKIQVRIPPRDRICHAKIIIVDDKVLVIGSHNLSTKSCHNNIEASIVTPVPAMIGSAIRHYLTIWNRSKPA